MAQSDYIQFIKTADILQNQKENLSPVLTQREYTAYENYALETTIQNTKQCFSRLLPPTDPTRITIFDMEKKVSLCPTFQLCKNTNQRPNRVLNTAEKIIVNGKLIPYSAIPTYRITKVGVRRPAPIGRTTKSYTPATCTLIDGYIKRTVWCGKHFCKCRGRILTPNPLPKTLRTWSRTNPPPSPV